MATLHDLFGLRTSSALRNRVAAAGWNAAKEIFMEDVATPNHAQRLTWAIRCLRADGEAGTIWELYQVAIVLLQDAGTDATDAQIQGAVNGIIDKFAAVEV